MTESNDDIRRYASGELLELGDVVREPEDSNEPGFSSTWRVVGYDDGIVHLSGPGPCRGMSIATAPELELVRREASRG